MRREIQALKSVDLTVDECLELLVIAERQYHRLTGRYPYQDTYGQKYRRTQTMIDGIPMKDRI